MTRRVALALSLALVVASACADSGRSDLPVPAATGPPAIQEDVIAAHARQFDDELPERTAGSQNEQVASTYLLAHLQQAGYVVRLEAVPVGDLVRSTDVIARPPAGGAAETIVVVGYDTREGDAPTGAALGLFLELARALRVAAPDHAVSFAALGAERAEAEGGQLGSRRLVRLLLDEDARPRGVTLTDISLDGGEARVAGTAAPGLIALGEELGIDVTRGPERREGAAFEAADLAHTTISGDARAVGELLLAWLSATT